MRLRDDRGLGIVELMVAMAIGSVVLAAVYFMMYASMTGFQMVESSSFNSREAGRALDLMTKYMRETEYLDNADNADITYRCDRDDDGSFERVHYYLSGTTLYEEITELDTYAVRRAVLVRNVRNNIYTQPLFRYYKEIGVAADPDPATGKNGDRLTMTNIIAVRLLVDDDPYKIPAAYDAITEVYLRNEI